MRAYYEPFRDRLSEDSQRRLDRNALRLLDSKDERDFPYKEAAPKLVNELSAAGAAHHEAVLDALSAAGIPAVVDPYLVRGLDYYDRTVFEVVPVDDERAQGTIGGGGRYDGLLETLGGTPTPAIGFGTGIERIVLEMQRRGVTFERAAMADVFIVHRGEGSGRVAFRIAPELRRENVPAQVGDGTRSFKAQFRSADTSGARFAVILGESELERGIGVLKDLRGGGEQQEIPLELVAETVRGQSLAG